MWQQQCPVNSRTVRVIYIYVCNSKRSHTFANNFALLHEETSLPANIQIRRVRSDRRVSQSHAQGDPQYSARTLFALSHSEYPFHCRRERSFDRKHPRVSQGVREASSVIARVVENTAPRAGNIVRNDVINVPGSRIFKQEFNEVSFAAHFSVSRCYNVMHVRNNSPRNYFHFISPSRKYVKEKRCVVYGEVLNKTT